MVKRTRVTTLREGKGGSGPVVYWMSRDQRCRDNWALLHAREEALARKVPLLVLFSLVPDFLGATIRQYGFMIRGLRELEGALGDRGIPFVLLAGRPEETVPAMITRTGASLLVTDFDPLRIKIAWRHGIAARIAIPFHEVDAHNIVPARIASTKQEFGAYTIRPKIRRLMGEYLEEFPALEPHPYPARGIDRVDWRDMMEKLPGDGRVPEVTWIEPGEEAAARALRAFVDRGLEGYAAARNDPVREGQSNLSPYLHFGQLSAQRVALAVSQSDAPGEDKDAFLEELVVRRELSDNYCLYNPKYDHPEGAPSWARRTLDEHRNDMRPYRYSLEQLEASQTHDDLWNAAQMEMVKRGKMHGYLRMYWAKKILEWTGSPEEAFEAALYLNDRYELDGRDPNGYAGIAWSIGGVHDRAWGARPIFGKIRYMSYNGCRSKFDVKAYVRRVASL